MSLTSASISQQTVFMISSLGGASSGWFLSRQQVDMPQNHLFRGSSWLAGVFALVLLVSELLEDFSMLSILSSNCSRSSEMEAIDLVSSASSCPRRAFLSDISSARYRLAYLKGMCCFCSLLVFSLSSRCLAASSNPDRSSWRTSRLMAIWLILARKLAWQTLGWRVGVGSYSKQESLTLRLRSQRRLLIFSMSMIRSIWPVVSSLRRSSLLATTFFWFMPHFYQQQGMNSFCSFSFRDDFLQAKSEMLTLILQAGMPHSSDQLTLLAMSVRSLQSIIISRSQKYNIMQSKQKNRTVTSQGQSFLQRLSHLVFNTYLIATQDLSQFLLDCVINGDTDSEEGDFWILLFLEFVGIQAQVGLGELLLVEPHFDFIDALHTEVNQVEELIEIFVLLPTQVLLYVQPVLPEEQARVEDLALDGLWKVRENPGLDWSELPLVELLQHLGAGLFPDVDELLLLLDPLDLGVFVPLLVLCVGLGLVLEAVVELEVVAAAEPQQGVDLVLLDQLPAVEVKLLEDREQAILQDVQQEDLQADVVDKLVLVEPVFLPRQLPPPHRLLPGPPLPHLHLQATPQERNYLKVHLVLKRLLHPRHLHLAAQLVEPLRYELFLLVAGEIVEVGICDELLPIAHQLVQDAPQAPYVRLPAKRALLALLELLVLRRQVAQVVEGQVGEGFRDVGQAEVNEAVGIALLDFGVIPGGDCDGEGRESSEEEGRTGLPVPLEEADQLVLELLVEFHFNVGVVEFLVILQLPHPGLYLVVENVAHARKYQVPLLPKLHRPHDDWRDTLRILVSQKQGLIRLIRFHQLILSPHLLLANRCPR